MSAIDTLRQKCNGEIRRINAGAGNNTPGFAAINALLRACDDVFLEHDAQRLAWRERAIERMIRWREMACDYDGADRLRERDADEMVRSDARIKTVVGELMAGMHA